ncbi:MAG: replication initiation protein, partial [Atopostipes suicloacalis]|nr:replication initiation protein [Atopostipes suicloacalis]
MSRVTKYRNELNSVPMRKWTAEEQDFFFAIVTKARNKGTELLKFNKKELNSLANYSDRNNQRFVDTIESLGHKIADMSYFEKRKNSFKIMNLFQRFEVEWADDYSNMYAEVRVSEDFEYILNKLDANFTQFQLQQFTNIRSTYAKEMFKKLKQWRTVGIVEFPVDDFREMLQIPPSYRASDINKVVLTPMREELPEYFKDLKVKPVKANTRGNPIIAYRFTFKPEITGQWDENKYKKGNKKIETLPHWFNGQAKTEKPLSEEAHKELQEKLKRI